MSIPSGFRPMLAISSDKVKTQPFVRYASEKLNGCRIVFFGGVAYSRTIKPFPNKILQQHARTYADLLEGCDGEVVAGDIHAIDVLQNSTSFCMNADKNTFFEVFLFDRYEKDKPWIDRYLRLAADFKKYKFHEDFQLLEHYHVVDESPQEGEIVLEEFEAEVLSKGGEGVMVRDAHGKYKFGRSATHEPELQKVKRMQDAEFEVVSYAQFEHNQNDAYTDEVGHTKRSTSKDGKVLVEQLGSLVCKLTDGQTFNVGSGFTLEQRIALWASKEILAGKMAKVQFFHYSPDGKPLLPVFLDFRHELDM